MRLVYYYVVERTQAYTYWDGYSIIYLNVPTKNFLEMIFIGNYLVETTVEKSSFSNP